MSFCDFNSAFGCSTLLRLKRDSFAILACCIYLVRQTTKAIKLTILGIAIDDDDDDDDKTFDYPYQSCSYSPPASPLLFSYFIIITSLVKLQRHLMESKGELPSVSFYLFLFDLLTKA
jgi:hypothetical protein